MSTRSRSQCKKKPSKKSQTVAPLSVLRPNVAGIDLGSREHWVCGPPSPDGQVNVRTFATTTRQLEKIAKWLKKLGVESVAMESTSVYWIPLHEVLESQGFEVLLVNASHLRNVSGRKTDMLDCQWIQQLHSYGLLRGSFRPREEICALRAMQRQLSKYQELHTRFIQWMQKALDQMNVQVHRAVTDLSGKTGMAIVRAIVDGERDPEQLAKLRDKRCSKSVEEFAEHLSGNWREEHLFNLASALRMYDWLEVEIGVYEQKLLELIERLQPEERKEASVPSHPNPLKEKAIRRRGEQEIRTELWRFAGQDLTRIDGISSGTAKIILFEIGPDLSKFPTEKNFVAWLRLCPRMAFSAGKPLHKKRKGLGANRVAQALRMSAQSLKYSRSALGAYYRKVARHKGGSVAIFATARKLATLVYRMLRYGQDYTDIGEEQYEERFRQRRLAALRQNAKALGFTLTPDPEAA
jgi:transposase